MLKTKAEIARLKRVSRQAIDTFISSRGIQPVGKKGKYKTYDTNNNLLASYLAEKEPRSGAPSRKPRGR